MNGVIYFFIGSALLCSPALEAASSSSDSSSSSAPVHGASKRRCVGAGLRVDEERSSASSSSPSAQNDASSDSDDTTTEQFGCRRCSGGPTMQQIFGDHGFDYQQLCASFIDYGRGPVVRSMRRTVTNNVGMYQAQSEYIFEKAQSIISAAFQAGGLCKYVYDIRGFFAEKDIYPEQGCTKKNHLGNHMHLFVTQCFGLCSGLLVQEDARSEDADGIVPPGVHVPPAVLNGLCMDAVLKEIAELPDTDEVTAVAPQEEAPAEAVIEPVI